MIAPHYSRAFGVQWQAYQRTQLDSYTGLSISRERLERCLGAPVASLRGRRVLEVGSGAGRFTEILVRTGANLVSIDVSSAVIANRNNCQALGHYALCQADVNASPLLPGLFDVVICLGVIQHTPSPEGTIANLVRHLQYGGLLVIDHYSRGSNWNAVTLAVPARAILRRLARRHPLLALRATMLLNAISDPIRKRTCHTALDRVASRLLPSACYYAQYPDLPPDVVYAWNALDTHDSLTDWYKHRRSLDEIAAALRSCDLVDIECWYGGNGVEARARRRGTRPNLTVSDLRPDGGGAASDALPGVR